jgi:Domain of unknown function (DUF222)
MVARRGRRSSVSASWDRYRGGAHGTLQELADIRREIDRLEHLFLQKLAVYDRNLEAHADGYVNSAVVIRPRCRMTPGAARGHVDMARKLEALPLTSAALAAGDISRHHAAVIAKAYTPEPATAIAGLEATFVAGAKRTQPHDLAAAVQYATDAIDGDGGASRDQHERALRRLHLSTSLEGVGMLDGRLDSESTEIVSTVLDAEMERDLRREDPRTRAQRRADALVHICREALNTGTLGTRRRLPHLTVVIDLERLDDRLPAVHDARGQAAHVGRLSQATLDRLTCDSRSAASS